MKKMSITAALAALPPGHVEPQPKAAEKPKFKDAVHPATAAAPGLARELSNSDGFKKRCVQHNVTPTRRQASKFLQGRGALWNASK